MRAPESRATQSPGLRVWTRFKANRQAWWSLVILASLFALSLGAELIANDKPLVARYDGRWFLPLWNEYPETAFGGELNTEADYHEPFVRRALEKPGNFALYSPNGWGYAAMNYYPTTPHPAPPSLTNLLGTDIIGRDIAARLLYAFRISMLFGLGLTAIGVILGVAFGAIQGFFGGSVDLITQRLIEVWGSLPELYLLIIFASLLEPSIWLIFVLLSMFSWIGLSDYVRAEFLRNRHLEYVSAARAMGLSNWQIMWRHVLPNSLTPVITFIPFRISAAIMALTSLDFLGLGVPAPTPSLGELLAQGKTYLYAWWISIPTFVVLISTLLLLTFIGDGLRNAMDTRSSARLSKVVP